MLDFVQEVHGATLPQAEHILRETVELGFFVQLFARIRIVGAPFLLEAPLGATLPCVVAEARTFRNFSSCDLEWDVLFFEPAIYVS